MDAPLSLDPAVGATVAAGTSGAAVGTPVGAAAGTSVGAAVCEVEVGGIVKAKSRDPLEGAMVCEVGVGAIVRARGAGV